MHTMHIIASSIANVVAGRQPLASILIRSTDTTTPHIRPADHSVDPFTVRFAEDMPVARPPVLDQDEDYRMATIPMAGQAQTPIHRRVKVVQKADYENGSFIFARRTPKRPTGLRSPPLLWHKSLPIEDDDVTEEMKEEYGASRGWIRAQQPLSSCFPCRGPRA
jgi:hypothetical protein